ncbi:hypothetical protein [Xenorhabdus littoralis]|nr:hypothetical protein [Xenorhabdus sp. psl]
MDLLIQDSKRFIDNLFWIVWAGLFWVKSVGKKCQHQHTGTLPLPGQLR